jgi:hypothetical protein
VSPSTFARSRIWAWPITPDTYVDPELVCEYLEEESARRVPVDPWEVRAYFEREAGRGEKEPPAGTAGSGRTRPSSLKAHR